MPYQISLNSPNPWLLAAAVEKKLLTSDFPCSEIIVEQSSPQQNSQRHPLHNRVEAA